MESGPPRRRQSEAMKSRTDKLTKGTTIGCWTTTGRRQDVGRSVYFHTLRGGM